MCNETNAVTSATSVRDGKYTRHILAVFAHISQIPRCSKQETRMAAWLVEWAKRRGFSVATDHYRNVLITVPAAGGCAGRAPIVLQAHMDMVAQKNDDSLHDFTKDPIVLVREGDWLRADGTTLGADNGIGMAIALALAEEEASSPRPALEILITADEEGDMTGAAARLSSTLLTGRKCINIDSETEGAVTLGAAGGIKTDLMLPLTFAPLIGEQAVFSLRVDGLLGGHSGLDIHKNRANANVLLAEAVSDPELSFRLIRFHGGTADNAITRTAEMTLAVPPHQVQFLQTRLAHFVTAARRQYPEERQSAVTLMPTMERPERAATADDSEKVVQLIRSLPQGVCTWSSAGMDLPATSNNIGVVKTEYPAEHPALRVTTFQRGFQPEELENLAQQITRVAASVGAVSSRRSTFPAWPPKIGSELHRQALVAYEKCFGVSMRTVVLHAGLECGHFAERYPDMEIISIGPTLEQVHTPRERLYVPSLERVAYFLRQLLQTL